MVFQLLTQVPGHATDAWTNPEAVKSSLYPVLLKGEQDSATRLALGFGGQRRARDSQSIYCHSAEDGGELHCRDLRSVGCQVEWVRKIKKKGDSAFRNAADVVCFMHHRRRFPFKQAQTVHRGLCKVHRH